MNEQAGIEAADCTADHKDNEMMSTAGAEARPYLGRYPAPLSIITICLRTYVPTGLCEGQYI
jgi:hypothetical protein